MPTKKQLTADEHAELGRALAGIYAELQRRSVQVGERVSPHWPEVGSAQR